LFPYDKEFEKVYIEKMRSMPESEQIYARGRLFAAHFSIDQLQSLHNETALRFVRPIANRFQRGRICSFSRKSRKRLLELTARLRKDVVGMFLTFTYRGEVSHVDAKKHLDLMLRWLKRKLPSSAFIWRMEYQRRGVIHFHVLQLGTRRVSRSVFDGITVHWQKVTCDESYPDIKTIHNKRHVMRYVSKYLAKSEQAVTPAAFCEDVAADSVSEAASAADAGFIYVPYSEKREFVGRFWGVVNRDKLPFADKTIVDFHGSALAFLEYRRMARRYTRGRCYFPSRLQGFTVFVNNSEKWLSAWQHVTGQHQELRF